MQPKNNDPEVTRKAMAPVRAPDLGLDAQECVMPEPGDPCTIVILGATGDLTSRKLMPALFDLYLNQGLPDHFLIVGCGRIDIDRQEFSANMQTALKNAGAYDEDRWPHFAAMLHYCRTDFEDPETFKNLAGQGGIWTKNLIPAETGSFIWHCRLRFSRPPPG